MKRVILFFLAVLSSFAGYSQVPGLEAKNWYFGTGTDGIVFDASLNPVKVSNKMAGVGFEGSVVVSDPLTGTLLFYSDGQTVVTSTHVAMFNGTGLFGQMSGAQTVQCMPMPGVPNKYYLLTSGGWDLAGGVLYSSVVDFTDPVYPLGKVTNKNTLVSNLNYSQGNKLISKPGTDDYWWIGHIFNTNQYKVIYISSGGFSPPVTYTFPAIPAGDSYAMAYSPITGKLANSGLNLAGGGTLGTILFDFNSTTGVISNPVQVNAAAAGCGNFSPDGTKLYYLKQATGVFRLHQYDLSNGVTTNMNTCCYAHDCKTGPDGKMYFIHTYNNSNPIAVINFPNLTAVGNACGYVANAGIAGLFNGEVRRFPEFVITPEPVVLPLLFIAFTAEESGDKVNLSWKISSSAGLGNFQIEKRTFAEFIAIGSLPFGSAAAYNFSDAESGEGNCAYRIKFTDENGDHIYSETRYLVSDPAAQSEVSVFPNPCYGSFNISFHNPEGGSVEISIFDVFGKLVLQRNADLSPLNVDVSGFNAGVYFINVRLGGKTFYEKFQVDR